MALGGLYDQLGGGFFRYSVDRHWDIPHFEKMLYDNAALLALYADAYAATGEELYARVAAETARWVRRDLGDARGAFFATLDADSEGEEGKYYVWTDEELARVLTPEEHSFAQRAFGLERMGAPNFESHAWHLARAPGIDERELAPVRDKLLAVRAKRVAPGRDEKIIASWNGLMIGALARAARRLGRPELATDAARAVDFVGAELFVDGRLRAVHSDGRARFPAYLDDHAFLACALVELLQCRWRAADLELACALLDVLLERFADPRGGFFFTSNDHETLIHRPKPLADEAVPSGHGMAARALLGLGHLLGDERYLAAAEGTVRSAWHAVERYPEAHATLLAALRDLVAPPQIVVVRAPAQALDGWRRVLDAGYHPRRLAFAIPNEADDTAQGASARLLALRSKRDRGRDRDSDGSAAGVAYVCEGTQCRAPLTSVEALERALSTPGS
jgi:uncharacterized protein YyaL (SSP411 family)